MWDEPNVKLKRDSDHLGHGRTRGDYAPAAQPGPNDPGINGDHQREGLGIRGRHAWLDGIHEIPGEGDGPVEGKDRPGDGSVRPGWKDRLDDTDIPRFTETGGGTRLCIVSVDEPDGPDAGDRVESGIVYDAERSQGRAPAG